MWNDKLRAPRELRPIAPFDATYTFIGKSLTIVEHDQKRQHVMMLPLAGGPPVRLTHFETEPALITQYPWSKDGKKLAITRQKYNARDIVMFRGHRPLLRAATGVVERNAQFLARRTQQGAFDDIFEFADGRGARPPRRLPFAFATSSKKFSRQSYRVNQTHLPHEVEEL
jgi:hypothetical protein